MPSNVTAPGMLPRMISMTPATTGGRKLHAITRPEGQRASATKKQTYAISCGPRARKPIEAQKPGALHCVVLGSPERSAKGISKTEPHRNWAKVKPQRSASISFTFM